MLLSSEHRLIHLLPSQFRQSSGTAAQTVQSLKERDRSLITRKEQSMTDRRNYEDSQSSAVNAYNAASDRDGGETVQTRVNIPGTRDTKIITVRRDIPTQNDIQKLEAQARGEYQRYGYTPRETEAALESANMAFSNAEKRKMTRDAKREAIISGAAADVQRRIQAGESIDFAAEESKVASRLQGLEAGFQTDDAAMKKGKPAPKTGAPAAPVLPTAGQTRSQRLGLTPKGSTTPQSVQRTGQAQGQPGSTSTDPGALSGDTTSAPPSAGQIVNEEDAVTQPVLDSLGKRTDSQQVLFQTLQKLIGQQGEDINTFRDNAESDIEQIKQAKLRQARDSMDFEEELQDESLERLRRDELLAQEDIERKGQRLEDRQIADNAGKIESARTQLGARYGGFGSGKGMARIQEAQDEGNRIVREIQEDRIQGTKEHRNRLSDIERDYVLGKKKIINDHDEKVTTALNEALAAAMAIDEKELDSKTAKNDKTMALVQTVFGQLDAIRKETGETLSEHNRNILTRKDAVRGEMQTKKKEAMGLLQWHVGAYGNSNPEGFKGILKQMKDAGIDTAGISADAPTIEQLNNLQKTVNAERFVPGQYKDETGRSLGDDVLAVTTRLKGDNKDEERSIGFAYLESGDTAGFERWKKKIAFDQMGQQTKTDVMRAGDTIRNVNFARATLSNFKENDLGYYNSLIESQKPMFNFERDKRFVKLKAEIVSDQARIQNAIFGAALSEEEAKQAKSFLVDFDVDTFADIGIKLNNMQRLAEDVERTRFDYEMGNFNDLNVSQTEMDVQGGDDFLRSLGEPASDGSAMQGVMGSVRASSDAPPITMDRYVNDYGLRVSQGFDEPVDYIAGRKTHGGYDISGKGKDNAPIKAFAGGEVVEANANNGGWGNEVWVRDDNGDYWRYTHLKSFDVKPGDKITPGRDIARMGNTGHSTGPHVHVEKHKGAKDGPLIDFYAEEKNMLASTSKRKNAT